MAQYNRGRCVSCCPVTLSIGVYPATLWVSKATGQITYADYNVGIYDITSYDPNVPGSRIYVYAFTEIDLKSSTTLVGSAGSAGSYFHVEKTLQFTYQTKGFSVSFKADTYYSGQEYRYENGTTNVYDVSFTGPQ